MVFRKQVLIRFLAVFAIVLSTNAYADVIINEIMYNPSTSQGSDLFNEWIEIFNNGTSSLDLTNATLCGDSLLKGFVNKSNASISLNTTFTLAPSEFALITDGGTGTEVYGNFNVDKNALAFHVSGSSMCSSGLSGGEKINITLNTQSHVVDYTPFVSLFPSTNDNGKTLIFYRGNFTESAFINGTPGSSNDRFVPDFNKWVNPSSNNSRISGLFNITVNITDAAAVNAVLVNFNNTNFSMSQNNDLWHYLWNTSLNRQSLFNITVYFNDSFGASGANTLFNITVNNSPFITGFSPLNLALTVLEGATLNFSVNSSDPDDDVLNYFWFIDNALNSTSQVNFSYTPAFNESGTHMLNVTIRDASSSQVSLKWTITVANLNMAPVLAAISDKNASKNVQLKFNITADDLDGDILAFSSNKSGISVSKLNNSLAAVSWVPKNTDIGNHTINFSVSDGFLTDSQAITASVSFSTNTAPSIVSFPVTTAFRSERYTYDVDAVDVDNDTLFYSIIAANATGMSVDSSAGLISFTPSMDGFFSATVSVTDLISSDTQSFNIKVERGNLLKIISIDAEVDGKSSKNLKDGGKVRKEAKPGSTIDLKAEVKNNFLASEGVKIENIEVTGTIEGIDNGNDLEDTSSDFDLRAGRDRKITFKYNLPINIDDGDFDIIIAAEGEDENGNQYEDEISIEIEVEKEKHDIRFLQFGLSPLKIACSRFANLNLELINIGEEDEEEASFKILSDDLGLNFIEQGIILASGTEGNTFSKSIRIELDNAIESSTYPITANVYSDNGELTDTKKAALAVEDCITVGELERKEVVLITGTGATAITTPALQEPVKAPTISVSFNGADRNLLLLLASTFAFSIFFLFTAIVLYLRF